MAVNSKRQEAYEVLSQIFWKKQLLSRNYFYCILKPSRHTEIKTLLEEALKNRYMYKGSEKGESIKISSKWF